MYEIPAPMLAKAAAAVPDSSKKPMLYEPKWDGFRGLVAWDGETLEIGSRGAKPLTRYFPELVEQLPQILPGPCLLDGEIVVATGPVGAQRLDWEALSQRIHPAASRVAKLSAEFGGEVPGLTVTRPTLEDIYLSMINAGKGEQ